MINWNISGCIFKAQGQFPFMQSHTAMCIPLHLHDDIFRIYFSTRGERNNPQVGFIEIDINEPSKILKISDKPVLENGPEGHFDFNGLYSGCIVKRENELWMYYSGRTNLENGMYQVEVGLAISNDGGLTFKKYSNSPIYGRNINDPWLVSTPHVIPYNDGWRMYYLSGRKVKRTSNVDYSSFYDVRSAFSKDGLKWTSENMIHIPIDNETTYIAAPTISKLNSNTNLMTFSYIKQDNDYQLGAAVSGNLANWKIINEIFNTVEIELWDTSKAYPNSFIHNGKLYVFYCGNTYGKEGLGFLDIEIEKLESFF